jgi:hypothetical protein
MQTVALEQIEGRFEPGPQDRVDIALHPHTDLALTDRPGNDTIRGGVPCKG